MACSAASASSRRNASGTAASGCPNTIFVLSKSFANMPAEPFPSSHSWTRPAPTPAKTANRHNQAHSISRLIAEMAQIPVPTVGIILGNGYSGGAIPLATTNILLCVRDGVFNTIQPRGLAGIARKYDLSWQECAKYVGVSSYELCHAGLLDGVIDSFPEKNSNFQT